MAYLFNVDKVKYECGCGSQFPLCRLYFCRYCVSLRCANCTQHEPDVYYCPQCLQSHMAPEAKLYHMRCKTCYECPSCSSVMSLRAVTVPATSGSETPPPTDSKTPSSMKRYYLACGYCHWSTRDAGYEDKELGALHEAFFDVEPAEIKALRDAYHLVSLRDASEKTVRKAAISQAPRRKNIASLGLKEEALGSSPVSISMKLSQLGPTASTLHRAKQLANVDISDILREVKSTALEDVEPLSQNYLTGPLDLSSVSTVDQRLRDITVQASGVADFRPSRKHISIKKSVRCKKCDHSLCKPEFSTSTIKFKIQLLAQLQLPDVRIYPGFTLLRGQSCDVVLSVSNPDQLSACTFRLSPDNDNPLSTCKISTPDKVEFSLEPKNDAFSLDDSLETDPDKEQWLAYNHGSKIGLKCQVEMNSELLSDAVGFGGKTTTDYLLTAVCVTLHHTPSLSSSDVEIKEMHFSISINLGS